MNSESVFTTYLRAFRIIGKYMFNSFSSGNNNQIIPYTPNTCAHTSVPDAPFRPSSQSRVEAGFGDRCVRSLNQAFDKESVN